MSDLRDGLIAWWKLDDNAASIYVVDSSDEGHDGTANFNTVDASTLGIINRSLDFGGTANIYSIGGASSDFDVSTTNFSISLWVNTTSSDVSQLCMCGVDLGDFYKISLTAAGKISFTFSTGDESTVTSTEALNDGEWHHIVVIRTGPRTCELYVDKILDAVDSDTSGGNSSIEADTDFYIGSNTDDATEFLTGELDDIRMYNKIIPFSQVVELNLLGEGIVRFPKDNLVEGANKLEALGINFTSNPYAVREGSNVVIYKNQPA